MWKERTRFEHEVKLLTEVADDSKKLLSGTLNEQEIAMPENIKRWFNTKRSVPPHQITSGNKVTALIDGEETFGSMVEAIRSVSGPSDFIYFANWYMGLNFQLLPGRPWSTMKELLSEANRKKVEIRGLLSRDVLGNWDPRDENLNLNPPIKNNWTKEHRKFFDSLEFASVIDDQNFLPLGLHHQKILVVKGKDSYGISRLIAFCGGVDIASNRLGPYHDVHCKIEGPAARQLLKLFCDRWLDNPNTVGWLKGMDYYKENATEPVVPGGANMFVQIGTTFGNGHLAVSRANSIKRILRPIISEIDDLTRFKFLKEERRKIKQLLEYYSRLTFTKIEGRGKKNYYKFAENGDRSAYWMIVKAIEQAKSYIYLEEQYMMATNLIAKKLNEVINDPNKPNLKIIIVIPDSRITTDMVAPYKLRGDFIKTLTANKNTSGYTYPHPRISICYRKVELDHNYVHAKVWLCDDKYAIIGSANCDNRGYTHDSEVLAGIYDSKVDQGDTSRCNQQYNPRQDILYPRCPFAKELRIRLWKHHLNFEIPKDNPSPKELNTTMDDPQKSLRYWFDLLPSDSYVRHVPTEDMRKDDTSFDLREYLQEIIRKRELVAPEKLLKSLIVSTGQIDPRGDK